MASSRKIKDFQFDYMVVVLIGSAIAVGAAIIIQLVSWAYKVLWLGESSFSPTTIYSNEIIQLIMFLVGVSGSWIVARKILPGSPELTDKELLDYDNSLMKKDKGHHERKDH